MSENKDQWQGVGYGVETRDRQVATVFDGLLHSAIRTGLQDQEFSNFLGRIEPATRLTNRTLLAKTAKDLSSPGGIVIVQIVDYPKEDFLISAAVATLSVPTVNEIKSSKKVALLILNESSPKLKFGYRRKAPFFRRELDLQLNRDTVLQVFQEAIANQVRLETEPDISMTRTEYFTLLDQAKSNG